MRSKTSESQFIKKIASSFPKHGSNVLVGIGDDAAVLKGGFLLSCDVQVEGVHFKRGITPEALGRRAVAVALSDIAAMGGIPQSILVSLGLPATTEQTFVDKLFKGIKHACRYYRIDLIGGNLSKASKIFIDCFVLGKAVGKPLLRSGAKVGDKVLVTGTLGRSPPKAGPPLAEKIPIARIKEGQIIAASKAATAMIDVSDGLSTDLLHICDASNVGVRIFTGVISAINGGEDYELCFTAKAKDAEGLAREILRKTGTNVSIIGEIISKKRGRWIVDRKGRAFPLVAKGWDHFTPLSASILKGRNR